jgi:hypothetical protein
MNSKSLNVRPNFHIQNIFDALNPLGNGVNDSLKLRCLQLQNRVVGLANSGDIVVVEIGCSQAFIEYILNITGATDVLILHHKASRDMDTYISAESIFSELHHAPIWDVAQQRRPGLSPYIRSVAVYVAARAAGITIPEDDWKLVVENHLFERMNDKSLFHKECKESGIPVPKHWVVSSDELVGATIDLLTRGYGPLYIRPTKSGGMVGNITVDLINSEYVVREHGIRIQSETDFVKEIQQIVNSGFWNEYVIAKLMELVASPGTLFFANDECVKIISHSSQRFDTSQRFLGFVYPIKDEEVKRHFSTIETSLQHLIEPWRRRGYRGFGNIDWMVTKDGEMLVAERNIRQTAVVAPLMIVNKMSRADTTESTMIAPPLSVLTRDALEIEGPTSFETVYATLHKANVLIEQNGYSEGVIITMPPLPRLGINAISFMTLGSSVSSAYEYYDRTLKALGHEEEESLGRYPIDS